MARLGGDRDRLDRYPERVHERYRVRAAILFGSRNRGDELKGSDCDLLLVSPAFEGMAVWDRIQACVDLWDLPEPLEVVPLVPAEFERRKADLTVVGEAVRQGTLLR